MNYFKVKKDLDGLMYKTFNLVSDLLFLLNKRSRTIVRYNKELEDRHKNERCFIIGTGPSLSTLTDSEIGKLENEIVFGVNSFFKIEQFKDIIPRYYMMVDDVFWRNTWVFSIEDVLSYYGKSSNIKIITDYRAEQLLKKDDENWRANFNFLHCKKYPVDSIDYDMTGNMSVGINVVSYAIFCAIYMGFKEIYLLGCDYNSFATPVDEHFYEDKEEQYEITDRLGMLLSFFTRATEIHYLLRDFSSKKKVKIFNATPGSLLDAYPKVNISDVLR